MLHGLVGSLLGVFFTIYVHSVAACTLGQPDNLSVSAGFKLAERSCNIALEHGREGEEFRFQHPPIAVSGAVIAGRAFVDDRGVFCRRTTITVVAPVRMDATTAELGKGWPRGGPGGGPGGGPEGSRGGGLERQRWSGIACRSDHGMWGWADVEIRTHAPIDDGQSMEGQ